MNSITINKAKNQLLVLGFNFIIENYAFSFLRLSTYITIVAIAVKNMIAIQIEANISPFLILKKQMAVICFHGL